MISTYNLPKILVIDDQFGRSFRDRRNLCALFGLNDITGDDSSPELVKNPLCEALFCSGQIRSNGRIENSHKLVHDVLAKGWPSYEGWRWSLILLDLRFVSGAVKDNGDPRGHDGDDTFGIFVLEDIRRDFPDIPVIIISSRERAEVIEECRKKGACDFIQRAGYSTEEKTPREILFQKIVEHGLIEDHRILHDEKLRIIGRSVLIMKAMRDARRAATGNGNILLLGETGTGKELFARYMHDVSPKAKGPYKILHPFGTVETLQSDELFGHVKGAFTDAKTEKAGLFELANGGTLFVDEIGDIPDTLQLKLMRALETRVTSRQGSNNVTPLDLQVVLATNKNLDEYANEKRFRNDLLNRINACTIMLPPLRDRKEDIPYVTEHLLTNLCYENKAWPRKILPETTALLFNYDWPDNVRGLRNVLERAIKNNKESEVLVPFDIQLENAKSVPTKQKVITTQQGASSSHENIGLDRIIELLSQFEFSREYSDLHGKLPGIQNAIARFLINYLNSALEVSKRRRAGDVNGELNITGAASCMMGTQLKTPKAADIIKKLLKTDKSVVRDILEKNPPIKELYKEVLRLRPSKPNNNCAK